MSSDLQSLNIAIKTPVKPTGYINDSLSTYKSVDLEQDSKVLCEKIAKMTKRDFDVLVYERHLAQVKESKETCIDLKRKLLKCINKTHDRIFNLIKKIYKLEKEKSEIMTKEYFNRFAKSIYLSITNAKKIFDKLEKTAFFLKSSDFGWYRSILIDSKFNIKEMKKNIDYFKTTYNEIKTSQNKKRLLLLDN